MSKLFSAKTSTIFLGIFLLVVFVYPVNAVTTDTAVSANATEGAATKAQRLQDRINTKKENLSNKIAEVKDKQASRAAVLKAKLQVFRNQKKAEITEKVSINLNAINKNRTNQMQNHLDRMSVLLDKLQVRVDQQTADIKDLSLVRSAIASAEAAIATASAAVSAQAQKDYTVSITSEAKVRADVKAQRDKLHSDLLVLRKIIIDAKQSVASAIRVAKSAKGGNI